MKKLLLLLIVLVYSTFGQYTTPNTGINWNLDSLVANSGGVVTGTFPNYAISSKITISANDRIFINPGTKVLFSGSTSGFDINGKFYAVGTATDSIIFSSSTQDSLGAAYNGFYFMDPSVDTACVISYARIEYAYYGLRCVGASPTLTHSYLWKCRRGANLSSDSHPIIKYNKIERNYEYGITLTTGCSPIIEYNELINNNSQNTSAKNQISIGTQGNNSPTIRYNKIQGGMFNKTGGISVSTLISGSSSSSEIAYNEIFNNSFGMTFSGTYSITCYVHDNKIYNNNINPDPMTTGSGINVNGTSVNQPKISKNEIFGNWWGITIQNGTTVQAGPQPNLGDLTNADTTDDGKNIIYNNIQGTNIYDVYNNCTNDIKAQNNDWRVYDSSSIEQHIYHKTDDPARGLIQFMPFSSFIPVELVSFTSEKQNGTVVLKWKTSCEKNNSGFEVQRKTEKGFTKIGFVNGSGTSCEMKEYSFTDNSVLNGKVIYRLLQIDFNGTITKIGEIELDVELPEQFALFQNYPNPFNPSTKIKFETGKQTFVSLKVFDVLGNEVATLLNEEKQPGRYEIDFNAINLSSGVYFYMLSADNFTDIKRMLLLK